jgi:probable F420-dependent oxidoreductase
MEPQGMREFAQTAEELGFDSLWVTDHIIVPAARDMLYKENMLEALSTLNYLAGVTSRMRIGTSVIVLPYRHPVQVAKSIATADQLSGGRVTLGVGVGGVEGEFRALKANFEERGAVADEYLRIIRSVWTNPRADFEGSYISFKDMQFSPPTVQQPHPPIWVGGSTRRAGRRAVEFGNAWHGTNVTVEMFNDISAYMQRLAEKAGTEMPGVNVRMPVYFDQPMPAGRIGLNGSDTEVAAQAQGYIDAGAEEVVFGLIDMPFSEAMTQLHRLSSEVAPRLR